MTEILTIANIPAEQVGIIIGAVVAALIGGGVAGKKIAESKVTVGPQPFIVDMQKEFLTRAEHDVYRAEVKSDFMRLSAEIKHNAERVDTKHLELLMTIERAAKTGVDGRVALWKELKPLGREVAALQATSNVAEQLAKLAESMKTSNSHGKTPGN